ncbi:hypothetical protein [Synechococcus phage S-H1]|nr:hypothetical protein [Synechococcus phage S-H1]
MSKKRFYFAIKEANVLECIWADSFTEAKQIAAADWLPYWSKIQWLNHPQISKKATSSTSTATAADGLQSLNA